MHTSPALSPSHASNIKSDSRLAAATDASHQYLAFTSGHKQLVFSCQYCQRRPSLASRDIRPRSPLDTSARSHYCVSLRPARLQHTAVLRSTSCSVALTGRNESLKTGFQIRSSRLTSLGLSLYQHHHRRRQSSRLARKPSNSASNFNSKSIDFTVTTKKKPQTNHHNAFRYIQPPPAPLHPDQRLARPRRQRRALRQDRRLQRIRAAQLRLRRDGRAAAQPHRLQLRRRVVCVVVDEGGEKGEREQLKRSVYTWCSSGRKAGCYFAFALALALFFSDPITTRLLRSTPQLFFSFFFLVRDFFSPSFLGPSI
ncbi:hypothetical protein B5807_05500 [Epicoccum nigrum]|uniref:Uncharacterized protein n=1 Tax=Epicoccum nigrum TaxID=105696 RepID=A0A1Y2LZ55_EPING|nr:hypothetical protein B5807_05500 [Epicoccum nigrum]